MGPLTTSPIAHMLFTLVWQKSLTLIKPSSISIFNSSLITFEEFGALPTATINLSNSISFSWSLLSNLTLTEFFNSFVLVTLEPNFISKPCFLNSFKVSLEMSWSVIGRNSSRASITVTSEPSLDHTLPSSSPIIPAPTTPSFLGTEFKQSAPVLSTICLLYLADGISIGLDPVATIIFLSSIVSVLPSCFVTSTLLISVTLPLPIIDSTLFAEKRPLMPPVSLCTISSFLFIIDFKSNFKLSICIPCSDSFLFAS